MKPSDLTRLLKKSADEKYKKFSASLIPGAENIIGIRIPLLRNTAKEIYKSGDYIEILNFKGFKYQEEIMLQGMLIGLLKESPEVILKHIEKYIPEISNWALCDIFCGGLKFTKKNPQTVWDFILPYTQSKNPYEIRFAHVMMLTYFVNDEYIDKILKIADEFDNEDYYARMGAAWLISICFVKYPDKTFEFLEKTRLNYYTYNKSIQKICESLRTDKNVKNKLKSMQKNRGNCLS